MCIFRTLIVDENELQPAIELTKVEHRRSGVKLSLTNGIEFDYQIEMHLRLMSRSPVSGGCADKASSSLFQLNRYHQVHTLTSPTF